MPADSEFIEESNREKSISDVVVISKEPLWQWHVNEPMLLEHKPYDHSSVIGSSQICYGWPLNYFFVIDEDKNNITQLISITS